MTNNPLDVAADVAQVLEREGIPYVIGGSVASTLYGEPRATLDVDFALQLVRTHVEGLATALVAKYFLQPEAMIEAVEHTGVFNVIHRKSMIKVDMHVRRPEGIYAEEVRRARRVKLRTDPETYADVATPEDTLLQKLRWYRLGDEVSDRQWRDVLGILKESGAELDRGYMTRWAEELSVSDLLQRAIEVSASE